MRRTLFVTLLVCAVVSFPAASSAQDATRPIILNVTMDAAGDQLTITGSGFGPAPLVTIDGQSTPVLPGASDTQVTVATPAALLTTPGTYRLTVVDSVRQVGEVFVVASRLVEASQVALTTNATTERPMSGGGATGAPGSSRMTSFGSASSGGPVVLSGVEDNATPYRTSIGYQALASNPSLGSAFGVDNTAVGYQALTSNDPPTTTNGNDNTAVGFRALFSNDEGNGNSAIGSKALYSNTGGTYNTASGITALYSNTTGISNTAAGAGALYSNISGGSNTASGFNALLVNTIGGANTANGFEALFSNTSGSDNTAEGAEALRQNTTGTENVAVGSNAGLNATTGSYNIYLGSLVRGKAGDANTIRLGLPFGTFGLGTGQNQTFIAGIRDTPVTGGFPVVIDANGQLGSTSALDAPGFVRATSLAGLPASGAGIELAYNSGSGGIGVIQAYDRTGSAFKTLFLDGATVGINAQSGGSVGIGTGFPGAKLDVAGSIRATGYAGLGSVGAGIELLYNPGSGGIGAIQAYDRSASVYKTMYLDGSNLIFNIGSGGNVGIGVVPTQPFQMKSGAYVSAGGVWTNASSRTLKDQIADLPASRALDAFAHLKPVTFVYKASPGESHVGFIAEDVPDLVATQDRKSLAAMDIVAVLTKVVQEQQQQLTDQQATNVELRARLARLESLLAGADDGH